MYFRKSLDYQQGTEPEMPDHKSNFDYVAPNVAYFNNGNEIREHCRYWASIVSISIVIEYLAPNVGNIHYETPINAEASQY